MKYLIGFFFLFSVTSALNQEDRNTLVFYFKFNEFELSIADQEQLKELIASNQKGEFHIENITAYSDLIGDIQYNIVLCEKRIQSVEKILNIYDIDVLKKNAAGENYPEDAKNTADSKYWRRVEIQYAIVHPVQEIIDVPHSQSNSDFDIEKIKTSKKLTSILNIEFVPGEDILRDYSYDEIYDLYDFLSQNTEVYVFIRGHVCCADDFALSSARAHSVYLILVQQGINAKRIRYEGFSNSIPLVEQELTDEDRQKNRRVDVIFSIK